MIKTSFLIGMICTLSLLLGCVPGKSEQVRWDINQGSLWFGSDEVDWQEATKTQVCSACTIKHSTHFHPAGPSHRFQLIENDRWRASKVDEFRNWITIWQNNSPVKLLIEPISEQQLSLILPDKNITVNLQSKVNFTYQGNDYQLWVNSFNTPSTAKEYSNELDTHHIDYLLLSL
ncbi:hypothetical protein L2729_13330 [Shewanella gelidimarina]|uniref:hypothetical protein n=1 Tax=Shewanella gelidimarina TaxID=56813 RepID=UPI00200C8D2F|nr:hypothetical protein [Shewanella gelidimarina]MCL1058957.1 hypothetical protein [Shewanella gelidimarina]